MDIRTKTSATISGCCFYSVCYQCGRLLAVVCCLANRFRYNRFKGDFVLKDDEWEMNDTKVSRYVSLFDSDINYLYIR